MKSFQLPFIEMLSCVGLADKCYKVQLTKCTSVAARQRENEALSEFCIVVNTKLVTSCEFENTCTVYKQFENHTCFRCIS